METFYFSRAFGPTIVEREGWFKSVASRLHGFRKFPEKWLPKHRFVNLAVNFHFTSKNIKKKTQSQYHLLPPPIYTRRDL